MKICLASRSPRRIELLAQMGLACEVRPADIDESVQAGETPFAYVVRLARDKARACVTQNLTVFDRHIAEHGCMIVLAADTTVTIHDAILGKPESEADAIAMLSMLSGQSHDVHTAVAGILLNNTEHSDIEVAVSSTEVQMMTLTDAQMAQYIASGEHRDKAGSYGIQGLAATWIKNISGSYTGVMGLPVYETAQILRTFGAYD